jgi:hypothetical protein
MLLVGTALGRLGACRRSHPNTANLGPSGQDLRPPSEEELLHGRREAGEARVLKTIGEAKTGADQLVIERANRGTEALASRASNRFGKNLRDATDHFVAHLEAERRRRETLLVSPNAGPLGR